MPTDGVRGSVSALAGVTGKAVSLGGVCSVSSRGPGSSSMPPIPASPVSSSARSGLSRASALSQASETRPRTSRTRRTSSALACSRHPKSSLSISDNVRGGEGVEKGSGEAGATAGAGAGTAGGFVGPPTKALGRCPIWTELAKAGTGPIGHRQPVDLRLYAQLAQQRAGTPYGGLTAAGLVTQPDHRPNPSAHFRHGCTSV